MKNQLLNKIVFIITEYRKVVFQVIPLLKFINYFFLDYVDPRLRNYLLDLSFLAKFRIVHLNFIIFPPVAF